MLHCLEAVEGLKFRERGVQAGPDPGRWPWLVPLDAL
jgi:hypothetical protein